MKKFFKVISIFIAVILVAMGVGVEGTKGEENVIRVGYYTHFNDIIGEDWLVDRPGYGYEVLKKMEEISDLKFEFVPIEKDLNTALAQGEVDVGGFAIRTEARKESMAFSQFPYTKSYMALMSKDEGIPYNDPKSIDGKVVATHPDNYAQQYLDNYCAQNNISVEYIYGDLSNYMDMDADFYITYSEDKNSREYNNVLNLGVFNLYMMSTNENQHILDDMDDVLNNIINTEGNFFMELEDKYLSKNLEINHRSLTQGEIDKLKERPLEVGYVTDFKPVSYTDEDGKPAGVMIDTLDMFADRYGFDVNYHPYSISDEKETYANYDMLLTIYGDSDYLEEHYISTDAYFSLPLYAQVPTHVHRDNDNYFEMAKDSSRIGSLPYQAINEDLLLEMLPDSEFVVYEDWHQLLDDYAKEKIDIVIHTQSGSTYAEAYLDGVSSVTEQTDIEVPMTFFISKDIQADYLPIFNVMFDGVNQEQYEELLIVNSSKYIYEKGLLYYLGKYWYVVVFVIILLTTIFVAILFYKKIQKQDAIKKAYETDELTGFVTAKKFGDLVRTRLKNAKPDEYEIISFDIDMFKTINTYFSVETGTKILIAIADVLKESFKGSDAIISRKTADQFLILRRTNDNIMIKDIYDRKIVQAIHDILGEKYNLSMSFGIYSIDNPKKKASTIIGLADNARTQGKQTHSTTFIYFNDKMAKDYENKLNITFRMKQALKDNEFSVVYQPKIDFKSLKVSGAEALVRWHPHIGETIYPDDFIPVFEANGFISNLDLYVLDKVCACIKKNKAKIKLPVISVNLSALTVLTPNIPRSISNVLQVYDIDPSEIELELTESAIESDPKVFLAVVKRLKEMGYSISIDDFGAGVSSLNRICAIEADVLKLDKAFFGNQEHLEKGALVVADVVKMAKHLDMKVVAEGVETLEQATWLKGINCDYAQGYYFSKPLEREDFKKLLSSDKQYSLEEPKDDRENPEN